MDAIPPSSARQTVTRRQAVRTWLASSAALSLPLLHPAAQEAQPEIRAGSSLALSGPAQSLGRGMKLGMQTCFEFINSTGGIDGRKLRLVALDDGYEPGTARENMNRLINDAGVLAVIGNVGTPTAEVTVPLANSRKTLLFGAFSGAKLLRKTPPDRYVINYRASYAEETAAMILGLNRADIRPYEVAFFSQNDAYGDTGYQGAIEALKGSGFSDAARLRHGRYKRNTLEVEDALLTILESEVKPRAILMIGTYAPCAKFIHLARRVLPKALFLNVSFVDGTALARILGRASDGVIVTQVVPHFQESLPLCNEYRESLTKFAPGSQPGFVSLEGYIVAKLFAEGLRRAGSNPNRESLIDGLENVRNLELGIGATISFDQAHHQGSQTVWATQIRDGKFVPVHWEDLKQ